MTQNSIVKNLRIGVTGGIASGKSLVCARLKELGAYVIDADEASRKVVEPGQPGLQALVLNYGREILLPDGGLDRKKLADIIFSSQQEREKVNAILHPLIITCMERDFSQYAAKNPGEPVFFEIPLLFEVGLMDTVDRIWLVTAPEEERLLRLMERDKISRETARLKIESQMPQEEKEKYAHRVIKNDSLPKDLAAKVDELHKALWAGKEDG